MNRSKPSFIGRTVASRSESVARRSATNLTVTWSWLAGTTVLGTSMVFTIGELSFAEPPVGASAAKPPVAIAAAAPAENAAPNAAAPQSNEPKPIPVTREEMKAALDRLKKRQPRLPLPEVTEEERSKAGEWGVVNNGRMRNLYIPKELLGPQQPRTGGPGRGPSRQIEPGMSFDYPFSTMLFWIVSRVNNCHYCLGHQETKLHEAGVPEDRIAALDGDWSEFSPAEQAAFAFTRKLTLQPSSVSDADFAELAKFYTPQQQLELVYYVSRYNATNRWTDAMGIPQEERREVNTPTTPRFAVMESHVAPYIKTEKKGVTAPATPGDRGPLESPADAAKAIAAAKAREPRFNLVDEATARTLLPAEWSGSGALPAWVRLLVNFPRGGASAAQSLMLAETRGQVSPLMRAQIAWIAARNDRAWYAVAAAETRLRALGQTTEQIEALANPAQVKDPAERAVFELAQKLTVSPQWIVDTDIAELRKSYSDSVVAEIVYRVTLAAQFNRLTEAAQLKVE